MPDVMFQDMKRYVGFGDADAENLTALRAVIQPHLSAVTEAFYRRITHHQGTRRLITGGQSQLDRLRRSLSAWLAELFEGDYGTDYCRKRLRIGHAHVAIGMPQYYMIAAMEVVWQLLEERLRAAAVDGIDDKLRSLHKLLQLDSALMLESYKESYTDQIREGERAAVRERLDEAEHLAHIGHLAASLAHEIKNPLAGISGAVQVIRDALNSEHPHRPILTEILRQIGRLDGTVKDLLVYARPRPPRFQRCDFNRLVERLLTVLKGEPAMQRVRIIYEPSEKPDLYADEAQLEQLLMNLVLNAAQASADGGVVQLNATPSGDGLRLTVDDEGDGMDEETVRLAFDPFYTTKARGTGLGLPICRKIVEAHGGTISIQSVPGEGTTVAVRLPRFARAMTGGQTPDEYSRLTR